MSTKNKNIELSRDDSFSTAQLESVRGSSNSNNSKFSKQVSSESGFDIDLELFTTFGAEIEN